MKDLKKIIKIPIYSGKIYLVITDDDNCYYACAKHFKVYDEESRLCDGMVLTQQDKDVAIYGVILTKNSTAGTIAHEASHVINILFGQLGVKSGRDNDEHYTYFLGWMVDLFVSTRDKYYSKTKTEDHVQKIENEANDQKKQCSFQSRVRNWNDGWIQTSKAR